MKIEINTNRINGKRNPMIYGQFIEHFHRQIYGGIYDPQNPLSDEDGFRVDVLEALRKIKVPILRWPGGCFVSAHHWKNAVGSKRKPMFDKAWRVEDPNTFGTDEYIKLCRKIGCEPYICTNAGTGTAEEMSDWVEYCNLEYEGYYAKQRIANGFSKPHKVGYWSIGNENYGHWEIGAKSTEEWGKLVLESAKMMRRVDPSIELSAAALTDMEWNMELLKHCGERVEWISIHQYWDEISHTNEFATYEECMAYTDKIDDSVQKVRGLLTALGLEKKIKIAFDEWNLRAWYHPNIMDVYQGKTKEEYLNPRNKNDINSQYTMADAVFTACFLNMVNRNCDIVGMANFSPIINTRGAIFTFENGLVLRSTYHVFDMYVNELGDEILDSWEQSKEKVLSLKTKEGRMVEVERVDYIVTRRSDDRLIAIAAINKDSDESVNFNISFTNKKGKSRYRVLTLAGSSTESYNDINHEDAYIEKGEWINAEGNFEVCLKPHSINIIQCR
jgi:Alpha-L-arabinofuranosidase